MKIRNIIKTVLATALLGLALPASADLIDLGVSGSVSGEAAEAAAASTAVGETVMFDYKCNFGDGGDGCDGLGILSTGSYSVGDFVNNPATSLITWNLTGTGYLLKAIIVKQATSMLIFGVDGAGMQLAGSDTVSPQTLDGKNLNGISHISFFVARGTSTVPEPGTLALLGLGLLGMGAARRRKVA